MWNAVRALNERGATYDALALDADRRDDESAAKEFRRRSRATYEQAHLAYEFMQRLAAGR
ncbi:MAG: hypothetical protein K8M05_04020 [Deltaproteobacteria bacterium]|nr:hypothetical protein [Kofleriaceae bacterium]